MEYFLIVTGYILCAHSKCNQTWVKRQLLFVQCTDPGFQIYTKYAYSKFVMFESILNYMLHYKDKKVSSNIWQRSFFCDWRRTKLYRKFDP